MWSRAQRLFDAHRETLAGAGIPLTAGLTRAEAIYCHYSDGCVHLALPDPAHPAGRFQATVIGAWLGLSAEAVGDLFDSLLPRLVAHEIGHALRDEAGRLGADPVEEEQAADRFATVLSTPHLADRPRARDHLALVLDRLGGPVAAAGLHRDAARIPAALHLPLDPTASAALRARIQADYWRDLDTYLRTTLAWAWIDLSLPLEDDLDACRRDLL